MKRFWMSVLVLMLSLQMGLASAHICAEEMPPGAHGAVAAQQHVADEPVPLTVATLAFVDACCTGSVCHEIHNAVDHAAHPLVLLAHSDVLIQSHTRLAQGNFTVRHERPNWSAA